MFYEQVFRASASTKKKAKTTVASKVVASLSSFQVKKTNSSSREEVRGAGSRKMNRKRPTVWNAVSILNDMRPHIKFVKSTVDCNESHIGNSSVEFNRSLCCQHLQSSDNSNNQTLQSTFPKRTLVAMTVTIDGKNFVGVGRSQKSAKQRAARQALKEIFSLQNMFT